MRVVAATTTALLIGAGIAACCGATNGSPDTSVTPDVGLSSPAGSTTCQPADLNASLGHGPDVAAAGVGTSISLENHTTTPCSIQGFVTLSYLAGADGPTIGVPAKQDTSGVFPDDVVTLRPGRSAIVVFSDVRRNAPECGPRSLWGYRILLPGQSAPIVVAQRPMTVTGSSICPNSRMVVAPVQDPVDL